MAKGKLFGFLAGLFLGATALISNVGAVGLDGFFISAPQESVQVYRKPSGGSVDTLRTATDDWGYWGRLTEQFNPVAQIGDTLFLRDKDNTVSQKWVVKSTGNHFLDMYQNKHTVNVENVIDTCHVLGTLNMEFYLPSFTQPETTVVDTGYNQGFEYYYDIHAPFDKGAAQSGRAGKLKLFKINGDTTFCKIIDFTVDKTLGDIQLLNGPIYFPDSSYIGEPNGVTMSMQWLELADDGVNVRWRTESELNANKYDIRRWFNSVTDTLERKVVGSVPAYGTTNEPHNYSYYDYIYKDGTAPVNRSVFYDIVQIDNDGTKTIYDPMGPITPKWNEKSYLDKVGIYPNPAKSFKEVKFDRPGNYVIYNSLGQKLTETDGKSQINLDVSNGLYFIREKNKNGIFTSKLMIVK